MVLQYSTRRTKRGENQKMNCELCNSKKLIQFYDKARYNQKGTWLVCKKCGFVFNKCKENLLLEFAAHKWKSGKEYFKDAYENADNRLGFAWPFLKEKADYLEVGCGTGAFLGLLKKSDLKAVGIEPEKAFFKEAIKRGTVFNGTFEEFKSEKLFDAVFFWHSLEHFKSVNSTLSKAAKLLKPGGLIFIEVPNIKRPYAKLSFFFTNMHASYFSTNTLNSFLIKNGFTYGITKVVEPYGFLRCVAGVRKTEKRKSVFKDNWPGIVLGLYLHQAKYYFKRIIEKLMRRY